MGDASTSAWKSAMVRFRSYGPFLKEAACSAQPKRSPRGLRLSCSRKSEATNLDNRCCREDSLLETVTMSCLDPVLELEERVMQLNSRQEGRRAPWLREWKGPRGGRESGLFASGVARGLRSGREMMLERRLRHRMAGCLLSRERCGWERVTNA